MLGQDYYSLPAYSLCSSLPAVFVNKLYRYASPSILIVVMPLTKLVSLFVNFSQTTPPVDIINTLFTHFYRFQFSLVVAFLGFVYMYQWACWCLWLPGKKEEAHCKCRLLMLFVTTARSTTSKYRAFRVADWQCGAFTDC